MYYECIRYSVSYRERAFMSLKVFLAEESPICPLSPSGKRVVLVLLGVLVCVFPISCSRSPKLIAVIPRSCGTVLWEPEHAGATHLAYKNGLQVYWNAPPREDDVEGQIALLNQVVARDPSGIILTPDETLPLRTPVRRILSRGLPVVVIGTHLGIEPSAKLSYVLNDDEAGGQMAARRLGAILNGSGSVAILGVNPQLTGIPVRERAFENTLGKEFPNIRVVARRIGYYSVPQEQQTAEDLLHSGPPVDAIVALSTSSTRGAYYALVEFGKARLIKLIGFDQDLIPPLRTGGIDSIIMQRTYDMGHTAMDLMLAELHGAAAPGVTVLPPILMTRENLDSPEIYRQLMADWWRPE
jgi:ribose transport system substrate-binding protein